MLDQPISDAQGNKLSLIRTMPGQGVALVLTSADQRVVSFSADASALQALAAAFVAAAEVAQRAVRA